MDKLKAAITNGDIENVVDSTEKGEDGIEKVTYLYDIIGEMTEGEAMDATQGAIWSFANQEFGDETRFFGAVDKGIFPTAESALRREVYYNWLMNLEPTEAETIVINENNSVKDMSLFIGDKADGYAENLDDNEDNDVYSTALNFSLAFIPGENDDLLVHVNYIDMDGNEVSVIKRLAGKMGMVNFMKPLFQKKMAAMLLKISH